MSDSSAGPPSGVKFAKRVFLAAGTYGLAVLLPQYFLLDKIGRDAPPPITHPEYFYGFVGIAVAWQLVFLTIARDPLRYRPIMLAAVIEKAAFGLVAVWLFVQGRLSAEMFAAGLVDLILGSLFAMSYVRTSSRS